MNNISFLKNVEKPFILTVKQLWFLLQYKPKSINHFSDQLMNERLDLLQILAVYYSSIKNNFILRWFPNKWFLRNKSVRIHAYKYNILRSEKINTIDGYALFWLLFFNIQKFSPFDFFWQHFCSKLKNLISLNLKICNCFKAERNLNLIH